MRRPGGRGWQSTMPTRPGCGSCWPRRARRSRLASPTTRRSMRRCAMGGSTAKLVAATRRPTDSASLPAVAGAPGRNETPASSSGYERKAECIRPVMPRWSERRPTAAGMPRTQAPRASRFHPTSPKPWPPSRRRRRSSRRSTVRTAMRSCTESPLPNGLIRALAGSSNSSRCSSAAKRFIRRSAARASEIGDDQVTGVKKTGRVRMYRHRIRQQIHYGQFREYREIAEEVIARRAKLGLAASTLWAPTFGTANEVVWEIDYPDLATYERENEAFYSDAEVMDGWRRLWQHTVQGSIQDELLVEAPHTA